MFNLRKRDNNESIENDQIYLMTLLFCFGWIFFCFCFLIGGGGGGGRGHATLIGDLSCSHPSSESAKHWTSQEL